MNQTI